MDKIKKISIHRGLAELKTLDDRITKKINTITLVGLMKNDKLVNGLTKEAEFKKQTKADYQSLTDLINRKEKIKSAIVKANATTVLEIAGKKMTIADAINKKLNISLLESLLSKMKTEHSGTVLQMNDHNQRIEQNALTLARQTLGNEGVETKPGDVDLITKNYTKINAVMLADPLGIEKLINKTEDYIDQFKAEVDGALSEINAITMIDVG